MGAVSGMLGLGGGAGGTGFAGPKSASIQTPVTSQQATDAYKANQQALAQQQALVQALQAQNGLGNQTNVYNQLANVAAGQGPNPAQAMLANTTAANTANQAALMAGQRGTQVNPGMIARQAAQQGAANQQNAAGQAAALQAQQSLNALGQMGGLATTQAGQQIGATQGMTGAQLAEQQALLNSIAGQNQANVSMQSNINNANAGLAGQSMQNQAGAIGGLAQGAATGLKSLFADGGKVGGPTSIVGKFLSGDANAQPVTPQQQLQSGFNALGQSIVGAFKPSPNIQSGIGAGPNKPMMAAGGKVDALVSPGEQYLDRKDVQEVKDGKNPLEVGERIPGKPKHPGNDYRNDTVPKKLEEGGIVIPNEVMQSRNPHFEAMKFVHAHIAKSRKSLPKKK